MKHSTERVLWKNSIDKWNFLSKLEMEKNLETQNPTFDINCFCYLLPQFFFLIISIIQVAYTYLIFCKFSRNECFSVYSNVVGLRHFKVANFCNWFFEKIAMPNMKNVFILIFREKLAVRKTSKWNIKYSKCIYGNIQWSP